MFGGRWQGEHISLPVGRESRENTTNIIERFNQRARQLIANVLSNTRQPAPRGGDSLLEFLEGLIDWSIFNSGASSIPLRLREGVRGLLKGLRGRSGLGLGQHHCMSLPTKQIVSSKRARAHIGPSDLHPGPAESAPLAMCSPEQLTDVLLLRRNLHTMRILPGDRS